MLTVGYYLFLYNKPASNNASTDISSQEQQQATDTDLEQKKQAIEDETNPTSTPPNPTVSSENITLTAKQESNDTVTIFTRLANVANGVCTLEITNTGRQTSQTAEVIYQPEYSTCAGFSVPISSIGKGLWTIKLTLSINGTTVSNNITYEVK